MKIKLSHDNKLCVVFRDEDTADRWSWLFKRILRMWPSSYGAFYNAYCWR